MSTKKAKIMFWIGIVLLILSLLIFTFFSIFFILISLVLILIALFTWNPEKPKANKVGLIILGVLIIGVVLFYILSPIVPGPVGRPSPIMPWGFHSKDCGNPCINSSQCQFGCIYRGSYDGEGAKDKDENGYLKGMCACSNDMCQGDPEIMLSTKNISKLNRTRACVY